MSGGGVITPATVRQKEDGRYELVSGHRRKRACELAGFETLRSEIVDLNRDEATILMVMLYLSAEMQTVFRDMRTAGELAG